MRRATEAEITRWDELVAGNPDGGNSLQTLAWGDFKRRWGWAPQRYIAELGGQRVAIQFLARKVPLVGEIWYSPKGPGVMTADRLVDCVQQLRLAEIPAAFVKLEPEILDDDLAASDIAKLGLVKGTRDLQSKATIVIDLRPTEDEMLAGFNQSARRNIRKATAAGVMVEPVAASTENLSLMFDLMKATEARAGYGLRSAEYFSDYWAAQTSLGQAQLFFARHEGEVIAGIFVTYLGKRAWYKDGGSLSSKRDLGASYLMQWEVICWLKEMGIQSYDMVGVPNRNQIGTGHSRDGLYEFKAKFNPEITEYIGCWDLPLDPVAYRIWKMAGERLAGRQAARKPERFLY